MTVPRNAHLRPGPPGTGEWRHAAACAGMGPELFFSERGGESHGTTAEAKQVCRSCAVRDACGAYVLAHDERFGIWAGMTERERRAARRNR